MNISNYDRQTEAWKLYELGKSYNQRLEPNQYELVSTNIEFFVGNQWKGLSSGSAMASVPKPVFNIIKRICSVFVASLTSSASKVSFEPLANKQDAPTDDPSGKAQQILQDKSAETAAQMATSECENLFDKLKMDYRIRDAMFDGVQTGDYCAHFYWDKNAKPYGGQYGAYRGEIKMEMVDGINVMFGNPNTPIVEDQPYIIIIGRDTVKNLRDEYLANHPGGDPSIILPDNDYNWQAGSGGKVELGAGSESTGKALFLYYYTKKSKEVKLFNSDGSPKMVPKLDKRGRKIPLKTKMGLTALDAMGNELYEEEQAVEIQTTVYVSKHTQWADIFEATDTGLTYYPIAWGNWEKQKNQYHGRALVTGIIPNQIYINSMFALVMRHQQMLGFPKVLYDADIIGQWNNAVGQALAVHNLPDNKRMSDLYGVLQPADMSTQIMQCIQKAMDYTKECLGATDAQLGNVRPDNTSALIALQSASQVPLENPQANKYEWIEDIGRILLDMMGTYYGKRPVVRHETTNVETIDPTTNMPMTMQKDTRVVEMYDFSQLKDLWLNVRADVGASTYWSRIAIVQTLDNLKQSGVLDVIDYLERMPDEYIPGKDELISKLRSELNKQAATPASPTGENNDAPLLATLPDNIQQDYDGLSTRVKNTLLKQAEANTIGS